MSRQVFVVNTASDPAAFSLYDFLSNRGFAVYDKTLAEGATLVVFDTSFSALKEAISDAKSSQAISPPYRITVRKINPRNLMVLESGE